MNDRRIEEHREMFLGEELVYYVTVIDPCPTPSDLDPYAPAGRCSEGGPIAARPVAPAPVVEQRVPTKAEYVRSFAASGPVPMCVRATCDRVAAFVRQTRDGFGGDRNVMPRRVRKALARLNPSDLATYYDTGSIARVSHYLFDHQGRCVVAGMLA